MRIAFPLLAAVVSVCRWQALGLDREAAGDAERAVREEGKIKEDGTIWHRFLKLSLSAHWLAGPQVAPRFWAARAAIVRNPLTLLNFHRHYGGEVIDFRPFLSRPHP